MIVELIPKKERKPIFGQMFFLIVSVVLLAAVVSAFFLLQQSIRNARAEFSTLEKTFVEDIRPVEEELSASLQGYRGKTEILKATLQERKNALAFFALLEETAHPEVFFRSLTGDMETSVFVLEGEAQDFIALEQQRLIWNNQEEFQSELQGIKLGGEGAAEFTVEFIINPELLNPI